MPPLLAVGNSSILSMHGVSGSIHKGHFSMAIECHNDLTIC